MFKVIAPIEQRLRHLPTRVRTSARPATFRAHQVDTGDTLSFGARLAEHVAGFVGSWVFLGGQACFLAVWLVYNVLHMFIHFDPPPYILLNLLLSFEAAFTGPVLLIAANVGAIRDHAQAERMERLEQVNAASEARRDEQMALILSRLEALAPPPELPAHSDNAETKPHRTVATVHVNRAKGAP